MWVFSRKFCKDDSGATAIEYAIIALMISLAIISAVTGIGSNLSSIFVAVNAGFH